VGDNAEALVVAVHVFAAVGRGDGRQYAVRDFQRFSPGLAGGPGIAGWARMSAFELR
jgi:hypothetical protein